MVKRIASAAVVGFVLLAACCAVGQSGRESLPDAPSAVLAAQTQKFNAPVEEPGSLLNSGEMDVAALPMRQYEVLAFDRTAARHKGPDAVFRKYLYPSPAKQQPNSASDPGIMSRATHALAGTVVTRNESGKGRLKTSYLLRTLIGVAKDSASTPYWRRHFSDAASDFGSTVGSDAGTNLWNEFGPSIEHLLKNHMPGFVSRIGEGIGRG
ncbi:MAG: hypothetical protein WCA20_26730 [Candidatus Sulfotelmatobacter sp.]